MRSLHTCTSLLIGLAPFAVGQIGITTLIMVVAVRSGSGLAGRRRLALDAVQHGGHRAGGQLHKRDTAQHRMQEGRLPCSPCRPEPSKHVPAHHHGSIRPAAPVPATPCRVQRCFARLLPLLTVARATVGCPSARDALCACMHGCIHALPRAPPQGRHLHCTCTACSACMPPHRAALLLQRRAAELYGVVRRHKHPLRRRRSTQVSHEASHGEVRVHATLCHAMMGTSGPLPGPNQARQSGAQGRHFALPRCGWAQPGRKGLPSLHALRPAMHAGIRSRTSRPSTSNSAARSMARITCRAGGGR